MLHVIFRMQMGHYTGIPISDVSIFRLGWVMGNLHCSHSCKVAVGKVNKSIIL